MIVLRYMMRSVAALVGLLFGSWAAYAIYQMLMSYRYSEFIDIIPRFNPWTEVGSWILALAMLLLAFILLRFAFRKAQ